MLEDRLVALKVVAVPRLSTVAFPKVFPALYTVPLAGDAVNDAEVL